MRVYATPTQHSKFAFSALQNTQKYIKFHYLIQAERHANPLVFFAIRALFIPFFMRVFTLKIKGNYTFLSNTYVCRNHFCMLLI